MENFNNNEPNVIKNNGAGDLGAGNQTIQENIQQDSSLEVDDFIQQKSEEQQGNEEKTAPQVETFAEQESKQPIFSKQYFRYRFSKQYIQSNIKNVYKKYITFFAIVAVVLALDLILKSVFDQKEYDFIEGFIGINGFAHNTGAAFSLFSNATVFLLVLSIVCLLLYFMFEYLTMDNCRGYTFYVATSLMVGGTLGNLIDRVAFGYVRDFIELEFIDFPIFNIADCALTVGVILLIVWLIFLEGKEKKNAKNHL